MALSAVCFKRWTCIYLSSSIPQSPGLWSKPVCLCVCTWKHHILLSQFLEKLLSLFAASKQFSTTFQGRLMETLVFQPSETSPAGCTFTWKCGCDLMKSDNQSINQSLINRIISLSILEKMKSQRFLVLAERFVSFALASSPLL